MMKNKVIAMEARDCSPNQLEVFLEKIIKFSMDGDSILNSNVLAFWEKLQLLECLTSDMFLQFPVTVKVYDQKLLINRHSGEKTDVISAPFVFRVLSQNDVEVPLTEGERSEILRLFQSGENVLLVKGQEHSCVGEITTGADQIFATIRGNRNTVFVVTPKDGQKKGCICNYERQMKMIMEIANGKYKLLVSQDKQKNEVNKNKKLLEKNKKLLEKLVELLKEKGELANLDSLTEMHNRRYFDAKLDEAIRLLSRESGTLFMFMIDIDNFKKINDTHGHPVGDKVIRAVADTLKRGFLRAGDVVARYGGEEFIAFVKDPGDIPEKEFPKIYSFAEELRKEIASNPVTVDGRDIFCTVTIGIACLSSAEIRQKGGKDYSEFLIKLSDQALLLGKERGARNIVVI